MKLYDQLQDLLAKSSEKFPPHAREIIAQAQKDMRLLVHAETARGVGDYIPDATFKDATADDVRLSTLNENGPLVITFYRGGWCPYCNLELRAYQAVLDQIADLGGSLVAITPEKPDTALSTIDKNALTFPVLTDPQNAFAKAMGIAFAVPQTLQRLFESFGLDLPELNADTGWALPVPATFVVDRFDRIVLADVDADYTRRLEPEMAIAALRTCPNTTSQSMA